MKILGICAAVAVLATIVDCLVDLSREKDDESKASESTKTPVVTLTSTERLMPLNTETLASRTMSTPPPFADIKRPEVSEDEFFQGLHVMEVDRG